MHHQLSFYRTRFINHHQRSKLRDIHGKLPIENVVQIEKCMENKLSKTEAKELISPVNVKSVSVMK